MNRPVESFVISGTMRFRFLTRGGESKPCLFLHGLGGVAEVSRPTIEHPASGSNASGIGHKIPLIAPRALASLLDNHWRPNPASVTY